MGILFSNPETVQDPPVTYNSVLEKLNRGIDPNSTPNISFTPTLLSSTVDVEIAKLLIERGARVDGTLTHQIRANHIPMVNFLLSKGVNSKSVNLFNLKEVKTVDLLQILMNSGMDVNGLIQENQKRTLLHITKQLDIAQFLIANNADINAMDIYGSTPLDMQTNPDIIKLLEDKGALRGAPTLDHPHRSSGGTHQKSGLSTGQKIAIGAAVIHHRRR